MSTFYQPPKQQCKWASYVFDVYAHNAPWSDTSSGIYVMAGQTRDGRWVALYIGQASPFRGRLLDHERWPDALRRGATHIHAMVVSRQADRDRIERELIQAYNPPLNKQLRL